MATSSSAAGTMVPTTDEATADSALDEADISAVAQRRIGQVVAGSYRISRYIGSGGSSHVYEAEHVRLGKPFALKLLRPELDSSRKTAQRFRREAKAMARLQSEHVIGVVDSGELEDQTPYLVMELLQGQDLRSLLSREGRLPARRAVQIAIEACRGLAEVHKAGLVHRDLKPENLFITRRSTGEDWCKVLDFGVAKMEASQSTAQGAIIGTVRYMAPEQLAGGDAVGPATDVYAVGAILYECLAGVAMVEGDSVQQVMYRVMNLEPKPLASLRPGLPSALHELIEQCVAKTQTQRPQSADELAKALQTALSSEAPEASDTTVTEDASIGTPLPRKRVPARRTASIPVAAAALLLGVGGGFLLRSPGSGASSTIRSHAPVAGAAAAVAPREPASGTEMARPALAAVASAPSATASAPAPAAGSAPVELRPATARRLPRAPAPARAPAGVGVSDGRFDNANPYDE